MSDSLRIQLGQAMYQEYVEVSSFSCVYRMIETSSSALRAIFDTANFTPLYVVSDCYVPYQDNQGTLASDKVKVYSQ